MRPCTGLRRCSGSEAAFAELISREGCKTIRGAAREVQRAVETVRLSAEQADRLEGQTLPFGDTPRGENRLGWYTREPVGVVAAITPFNDPLNLVAHKVAPALIGGNGVVLKPAEQTPLVALAFIELLLDAGVPADRVAVLPGRGATVGAALVGHPRVDLVSFTGGFTTGNAIAATAGAKKTLMELGGNGTVLVLPDADVRRAAQAVVDGAFGNAGQNCLSVQRVFVARELLDELVERVVSLTERAGRRQQGRRAHGRRPADRRGLGRTRGELGGRSRRGRRRGPHGSQARRHLLLAHRAHLGPGRGPGAHRGGLRAGGLHRAVRLRRRRGVRGERLWSTGCRRASSPATSTPPWTSRNGCGSAP